MKNRKRNITLMAVLIFVSAAVALNWTYNNRWGTPDAEMAAAEDELMMSANTQYGQRVEAAGCEVTEDVMGSLIVHKTVFGGHYCLIELVVPSAKAVGEKSA